MLAPCGIQGTLVLVCEQPRRWAFPQARTSNAPVKAEAHNQSEPGLMALANLLRRPEHLGSCTYRAGPLRQGHAMNRWSETV